MEDDVEWKKLTDKYVKAQKSLAAAKVNGHINISFSFKCEIRKNFGFSLTIEFLNAFYYYLLIIYF
jgi:hypothetical protein